MCIDYIYNQQIITSKESQLPKVQQFYSSNYKKVLLDVSLIVGNEWLNSSQVASPYTFIKIITPNTFFVLNSCGNQWVLLTNYDCDIDVWHFYDSLNGSQYLKSMALILGHFGPIFPGTEFQIMYKKFVDPTKMRKAFQIISF